MILREINGQIFSFKFGLKWITLLREFLQNIEDEEVLLKKLFFLSVNAHKDWQDLFAICTNPRELLLLSLYKSFNFEGSFEEIKQRILQMNPLQLDQLYKVLVGEVGIPPHQFYQMTPHEAELAYQGYLQRKELEGNIMIMAIREAFKSEGTPIKLLEDLGYQESTLEQRERTFKSLGI